MKKVYDILTTSSMFLFFWVLLFAGIFALAVTTDYILTEHTFSVIGTAHYISIEGGFWGIISDDGNHYDPINLSEQLWKDGLRAEFRLKTTKNQASFHMWGTKVEILDYRILASP